MRETFTSSPQSAVTKSPIEPKYPWATLLVGKSFIVRYQECKLSSLRPYASRMGTKYGAKFRVVDHGEEVGYEVARIK